MPIGRHPNAVITGAAAGLGRAFALELAARGARLLLADIDEHGLTETAERCASLGSRPVTMRCDVSSLEQMRALADQAKQALGHTDLLINNAGVAVGGRVGTVPLEDWQWITGINQWGVVYGCHLFAPEMLARNSGHILNVASIAAFACGPEMAPYNVTKAAVVALSETLAAEFAGTGVGVTVLCPYFFLTNIAKSARNSATNVPIDTVERLMAKTRIQAPEVARLALRACEKNELYVFPHREARAIALAKRLMPELMLKQVGPRLARLIK